jgi:hypothetical protein
MATLMAMPMGLTMRVAVRARSRGVHHMAVAHAPLGDDVISEFLHIRAASLEHSDLHAVLMVEVHVERRLREIVAVMEVASETFREIARFVVIHVDERGDAGSLAADL